MTPSNLRAFPHRAHVGEKRRPRLVEIFVFWKEHTGCVLRGDRILPCIGSIVLTVAQFVET